MLTALFLVSSFQAMYTRTWVSSGLSSLDSVSLDAELASSANFGIFSCNYPPIFMPVSHFFSSLSEMLMMQTLETLCEWSPQLVNSSFLLFGLGYFC